MMQVKALKRMACNLDTFVQVLSQVGLFACCSSVTYRPVACDASKSRQVTLGLSVLAFKTPWEKTKRS